MAVALDQARWQSHSLRVLENRIYHAGCEDTGQQSADRPARTMNAEGIERVIVPKPCFNLGYHGVTENPSDSSNHQRRHWTDKACSGRDCHQSCDRARDAAQDTGLSIANPFG